MKTLVSSYIDHLQRTINIYQYNYRSKRLKHLYRMFYWMIRHLSILFINCSNWCWLDKVPDKNVFVPIQFEKNRVLYRLSLLHLNLTFSTFFVYPIWWSSFKFFIFLSFIFTFNFLSSLQLVSFLYFSFSPLLHLKLTEFLNFENWKWKYLIKTYNHLWNTKVLNHFGLLKNWEG